MRFTADPSDTELEPGDGIEDPDWYSDVIKEEDGCTVIGEDNDVNLDVLNLLSMLSIFPVPGAYTHDIRPHPRHTRRMDSIILEKARKTACKKAALKTSLDKEYRRRSKARANAKGKKTSPSPPHESHPSHNFPSITPHDGHVPQHAYYHMHWGKYHHSLPPKPSHSDEPKPHKTQNAKIFDELPRTVPTRSRFDPYTPPSNTQNPFADRKRPTKREWTPFFTASRSNESLSDEPRGKIRQTWDEAYSAYCQKYERAAREREAREREVRNTREREARTKRWLDSDARYASSPFVNEEPEQAKFGSERLATRGVQEHAAEYTNEETRKENALSEERRRLDERRRQIEEFKRRGTKKDLSIAAWMTYEFTWDSIARAKPEPNEALLRLQDIPWPIENLLVDSIPSPNTKMG